jgi:hypothetical protein
MAQGTRAGGAEIIPGPWGPITPPANNSERLGGGSGGPSGGGGGPPAGIDLAERIARVEAAIDGLRHSQNMSMGAMALFAAIVIGLLVYGLQRIDQTQETISREAAATRQELVGVANAIANSITAARQMQPPVIVVPAPSTPPAPSPPPPPRGK